jgi:hypothetical protein
MSSKLCFSTRHLIELTIAVWKGPTNLRAGEWGEVGEAEY